MELKDIKAAYFLGIGGIGMSALARYFMHRHVKVGGYDRTPTPLTRELEAEGAEIHYTDAPQHIAPEFGNPQDTLVVYTPAIPADLGEWAHFKAGGYDIEKRAQVLGTLTRAHKGLCVAGTHGKTTTTAMTAHLLEQSHIKCSAFLGGIAKNYGTNYLYDAHSDYVVIEADEFDRSFHQLEPYISVITATDPDHLDIYGTREAYLESFAHYSSLIKPGGALIMHRGLAFKPRLQKGVQLFDYSREAGDFHAENIKIGGGEISFDFISPFDRIDGIRLGVPVSVNIENGIAAMALAQMAGATADEIRRGMATYNGVERRFDFKIKTDRIVFLSDYAHHPAEIESSERSLREVFSGRKLTAIFQPHLYTRTRDFYREFAAALSLYDEVVLTPIYPAREQPIAGVTSRLIYDHLNAGVEKHLIEKDEVQDFVRQHDFDVLVVLGAGDLDNQCPAIAEILKEKYPTAD